jgi:hypothetical protein
MSSSATTEASVSVLPSRAVLLSQPEADQYRWALMTDELYAVCVTKRAGFPDIQTILLDMEDASWLCSRPTEPGIMLVLCQGQPQAVYQESSPPLQFSELSRLLFSLRGSKLPKGVSVLPLWILLGQGAAPIEG